MSSLPTQTRVATGSTALINSAAVAVAEVDMAVAATTTMKTGSMGPTIVGRVAMGRTTISDALVGRTSSAAMGSVAMTKEVIKGGMISIKGTTTKVMGKDIRTRGDGADRISRGMGSRDIHSRAKDITTTRIRLPILASK